MTEFTFRPLAAWPHAETRERRGRRTFSAPWFSTLSLLKREIAALRGTDAIIAAGFRESDIRRDGLPRADALQPRFPGVEVSFTTGAHGRLVYATDVCEHWQHNVRSIALGLESLRAVDRYGITRHGEQYAGFAALTSGGPDPHRGYQIVVRNGGVREALMATHPDHGGEARDFADVQAYRETKERVA